jgi:hypothetical protein
MSEIKHTPGPWTLNRHGAIVGGEFHQYTNGAGQSQLAMAVGGNGIDESQRSANARLIAAAPELLEALVALRREAMHDAEFSDVSREQFEAILNRADAAIAKVTGAQS